MKRARDWDPLSKNKVDSKSQNTPMNIKRIKIELSHICRDPPPGIHVAYDDIDLTLVHALIIGPPQTPYEGGFFYFVIRYPSDYPWRPPTVTFMTTGGSTVRFNPNLYTCGKVCLSILGTWSGPDWSPAMTLTTLLLSIQSLLSEEPYHNEPGYEKMDHVTKRVQREVKNYNNIIQHETLRVAVIGMVNNDYGLSIPKELRDEVEKNFLQKYDFYESAAKSKCRLNNRLMNDPFCEQMGRFQFNILVQSLRSTRDRLRASSTNQSPIVLTDATTSASTTLTNVTPALNSQEVITPNSVPK